MKDEQVEVGKKKKLKTFPGRIFHLCAPSAAERTAWCSVLRELGTQVEGEGLQESKDTSLGALAGAGAAVAGAEAGTEARAGAGAAGGEAAGGAAAVGSVLNASPKKGAQPEEGVMVRKGSRGQVGGFSSSSLGDGCVQGYLFKTNPKVCRYNIVSLI